MNEIFTEVHPTFIPSVDYLVDRIRGQIQRKGDCFGYEIMFMQDEYLITQFPLPKGSIKGKKKRGESSCTYGSSLYVPVPKKVAASIFKEVYDRLALEYDIEAISSAFMNNSFGIVVYKGTMKDKDLVTKHEYSTDGNSYVRLESTIRKKLGIDFSLGQPVSKKRRKKKKWVFTMRKKKKLNKKHKTCHIYRVLTLVYGF